MKLLLILGCLVLLGLTMSFLIFCTVFYRGARDEDYVCRRMERKGRNGELVRRMRAGMTWYHGCAQETWQIHSFDGTPLTASFLAAKGQAKATVILCHGWRSTAPTDFSCLFQEYWERDLDLLVIDQRGHGRSGGRWLGFGVLESRDLLCWVQEVNRRRGTERPILLHGMSMGAATVQFALDLELPDNVKGAVADCGFSSPWEECAFVIRRRGLPQWPLLPLLDLWARLLAGYSLRERSTTDIMTRNRRPVLWLHGERDGLVPCHMSIRAHNVAVCQKWLVTVPEAGHGFAWLLNESGCRTALEAFLQHCLSD